MPQFTTQFISGLMFMSLLDERVQNLISSLTNVNMPRITAFRDVSEVAITIATQQLFNINSKTVRDLANKFVPTEGKDMISKGLTIMHNTLNRNSDIKDESQKVSVSEKNFKHSMIINYDN